MVFKVVNGKLGGSVTSQLLQIKTQLIFFTFYFHFILFLLKTFFLKLFNQTAVPLFGGDFDDAQERSPHDYARLVSAIGLAHLCDVGGRYDQVAIVNIPV